MSAPVFLAPSEDLKNIRAGDSYLLTGSEGHHAAAVQRRGVGEVIDIVDGAGNRLETTVTKTMGRELEVRVDSVTHEEPAPVHLTIVQGLVKSDAEEAIAMMTEAGADAIVPWQSQRSIVKWQGERGIRGVRKWQMRASEAAKQSRRAYVPEVRDVVQNSVLYEKLARAVKDGARVFIAHEEATIPLREAAKSAITGSGAVWVVIGPEGGISGQELADFESLGAVAVSLGDHVLRAATAGTVATVLLRSINY